MPTKRGWRALALDPSLLQDGLLGVQVAHVKRQKTGTFIIEDDAVTTDDSDVPFDPEDAVSDFDEAERLLAAPEAVAPEPEAACSEADDDVEMQDNDDTAVEFDEAKLKRWTAWEIDEVVKKLPETVKGRILSSAGSLELPQRLLHNLQEMGWLGPTSVQQAVIPLAAIARKNVCIASETGSGKTGAFAIPIVMHILQGRAKKSRKLEQKTLDTLVIVPSRELAAQVAGCFSTLVADVWKPLPITVCQIVGGILMEKQVRLLRKRPDVVVATVGRLLVHLYGDDKENKTGHPYFEDMDSCLRHLVIDEADRVLEVGQKLEEMKRVLAKVPSAQFQWMVASATLALDAESDNSTALMEAIKKLLPKAANRELVDFTTPELKQDLRAHLTLTVPEGISVRKTTTNFKGKLRLLYLVLSREFAHQRAAGKPFKAIVFCNTIDLAKKLMNFTRLLLDSGARGRGKTPARLVEFAGLQVLSLHSQKTQQKRFKVYESIDKQDCVLIATDIAARGLDFPQITHVIHMQCPRSAQIFVHRTGRTGRGKHAEGTAIILEQAEEVDQYKAIFKQVRLAREVEPLAYVPMVKGKTKLSENLPASEIADLANAIETTEFKLNKARKDRAWKKNLLKEGDLFDSDLERDSAGPSNITKEEAKLFKLLAGYKRQLRGAIARDFSHPF